MMKQARWIVPLAFLLGLGATLPESAEAGIFDGCGEEYMWCLNDSWDTKGIARLISDARSILESWKCHLDGAAAS
jgi:hypothetical protein